MTNFRTFPDAEAAASVALRAAGIVGLGTRVYSSIPGSPTWPLATVARTGGLPAVRRYLDRALIEVTVWGTIPGEPDPVPKSDLHDIAQDARVALLEAEGTTVQVNDGTDAVVTGVDDAGGLAWSADPDTKRERYRFTMAVHTRPA